MYAKVAELYSEFEFSSYSTVNKKGKFVLVLPTAVMATELDAHLRQSSVIEFNTVCGLRQLLAENP